MDRKTSRDGERSMQVPAGKAPKQAFGFKFTGGGTNTDVLLFSTFGLPNMADVDYVIQISAEVAAHVHQDESTITKLGFTVLLAGSAVTHVTIIGTPEG